MPRIDGFALCRRLQATPATASIPIIFLSAAADIESRLSGLQNGARDYVIKPYSAEEVLAKIRLHLSLSPTTQTGDPEAAVSSIDADRTLVDAAKRYIDNHLRIDFSLADIANALATHKKRLSLAFHLHENKTVFQYVREARIQTAQRMLAQSNLSVLAIAEELGFSSAANFASAFNRHTGTTPSLYRQRMRHQRTSGSADGAAKDN
jgi:YesN/AraC family two-component response regulator